MSKSSRGARIAPPPLLASGRGIGDLTPRLSGLIGDIYEAAIDAPRIQYILDELAAVAGADNAGLSVVDAATGEAQLFCFSPVGALTDAEVLGMYDALEPWRRAVIEREPGRMYIDGEISLLHELTQSPAYQRWLQVSGNRSRASGYMPLHGGLVMFLGFARGESRRRFSRADVQPLELLIPHFARASRINRLMNELTVMHDVAEERYGQLGVGVVLADAELRVLYRSRTANRILRLEAGLSADGGVLHCAHPEDQKTLAALVAGQARLAERPGFIGGESMTLRPSTAGAPTLSMLVSTYTNRLQVRTLLASGGRALVLLFDPTFRTPTREQALQRLYGMSEPEAELAAALAAGHRLEQIAAERSLSKETLRSRLKRIFAKTGTRRQSELLRLLLASPALLEHRPTPRPAAGRTANDG